MIVDLSFGEIITLRALIKAKALQSLRLSKIDDFSEDIRKRFREDFHEEFNLYKKLRSGLCLTKKNSMYSARN